MKYEDIYRIAENLYLESFDKKNEYYEKYAKANCDGKDKMANQYLDMADKFYDQGKGIIALWTALEDFAEQSGEDVDE